MASPAAGKRIEAACGRKGTVHLRAVDPVSSRLGGGRRLVREPGEALCGKPGLILHPVPGFPADCADCAALAVRHGLVVTERRWPLLRLTVVSPQWSRRQWTHYRADEGLASVLFSRKRGQLLCHSRFDRRRVAVWPAVRGAVTCPACRRHARQLGYSPPGRCPVPGCPVRFAAGGDRPCRVHAAPGRHDRTAGPPAADPWKALRAKIAADVGAP